MQTDLFPLPFGHLAVPERPLWRPTVEDLADAQLGTILRLLVQDDGHLVPVRAEKTGREDRADGGRWRLHDQLVSGRQVLDLVAPFQPVPDLPPSLPFMDVDVVTRPQDASGSWTVRVDRIRISVRCPVCGVLRGTPYLSRQAEDGDWFNVHRWTNPCGHVDRYVDVVVEGQHILTVSAW